MENKSVPFLKAPQERKTVYAVYSAVLIISIIAMLWGIRLILTGGHGEIRNTVAKNIGSIQSAYTKDAEKVIRSAGEEVIRLKAQKVAKDIENYIIRTPDATIKSMQQDPRFTSIALQPVGKSGYTAVHEEKRSINRFHVNPGIVDTNLGALASTLPDFWKIITESQEGKEAGGYYKWREADGSLREKYMWVATVSRPTADRIVLSVAATTYIDEFMQPFARLSEQLDKESITAASKIASLSERTQTMTLMAIGLIIVIFFVIVGYMAFRLIRGLHRIEREVRERKRTEEALRESEERYRTILDEMEEGYQEVDLAGNFTFFNEAFLRIFGYSRDEMIGTNFKRYAAEEEIAKKVYRAYNQMYKTGIPIKSFEWDITRRDGARRTLEFCAAVLRDSTDRPTGFRGIVHDITDRKQAEEELHRLASVVKYSGELVNLATLEGKMTFLNEAGMKMLGIEAEEVGQVNIMQIIPDHLKEKVQTELMPSIKEHGTWTGDLQYRNLRTGELTDVYATAFTVTDAYTGVPLYLANVSLDVTERKQAQQERQELEERLQRSEKMEALGLLAGGVAHDLNNVLGIVVGYSELLLMKIEESSPIRSDVRHIIQGGERAAAIVQDLLTMARRGVHTEKVINLNTAIMDCRKTPEFERIISFHPSVRVQTELETNLLNIMGSPVHLGKALINLVSNACEAMPHGGLLIITTTNQYLDRTIQGYDSFREGDYVVLSVSDTGEGIAANDIKRIFEPFYTKKVMGRSGTGLGLAVVWGTVKDHHGYIDVHSEEGKGSTFTLYFPVTRDEPAITEKTISPAEYQGQGESILVVDDVKEQRELAASMLEKLGYQVDTVAGGEVAVEFLKNKSADLVVLDMIMDPGIDGMETYRRILEINPKQKAIIVSGFSETDRVRKTQEMGAGIFVRKPYILEKIGLAARRELDRK